MESGLILLGLGDRTLAMKRRNFFVWIYLLVLPKYWGNKISDSGVSPKWVKSKRQKRKEKREKERKTESRLYIVERRENRGEERK